jgi:hypothetical protein
MQSDWLKPYSEVRTHRSLETMCHFVSFNIVGYIYPLLSKVYTLYIRLFEIDAVCQGVDGRSRNRFKIPCVVLLSLRLAPKACVSVAILRYYAVDS